MKKNLLLFALFISTLYLSQNNQIISKVSSSMSYEGTSGGKSAKVYLENGEMLDCNVYDTFVTGWLQLDGTAKIPLAGYSKGCDLKLYNLGPQHNALAKTKILESNVYEIDSLFDNAQNILRLNFETCQYTEEPAKVTLGKMFKDGKVSDVVLNTPEITVHKNFEYYILPNGNQLDLLSLFESYPGHQFVSQKIDKDQNRIIFKFETLSNHNCLGQCGASEGEKGYRIVRFDKNWKITGTEEFLIESCIQNIYETAIVKKTADNIKYKILDSNGEFSHYLNVDLLNSLITVSNK